MCLIAVIPAGSKLPFTHARESFRSNPHGAGFSYSRGGKLFTERGFFHFKNLWERLEKVNGKYPIVFHVRYSTGGGTNETNCHPFEIDKDHALFHNGIIRDFSGFKNGRSDTYNFTENIIKPLFARDSQMYKQPFCIKMLSGFIGDGNKLVIMEASGETTIINEHLGNTQNLIWYSNFDYLPEKRNRKVLAQKFSGVKVKAFGTV